MHILQAANHLSVHRSLFPEYTNTVYHPVSAYEEDPISSLSLDQKLLLPRGWHLCLYTTFHFAAHQSDYLPMNCYTHEPMQRAMTPAVPSPYFEQRAVLKRWTHCCHHNPFHNAMYHHLTCFVQAPPDQKEHTHLL
ncbi:hypothetical protein D3C74_274800 [compost metagenome]